MNIYSKIDPTRILHIIHRKRHFVQGRVDLIDQDQFIQVAALSRLQGTKFKPHRHIRQHREGQYIPQESWVVVSGLVKVTLYDLDNSILHVDMLEPGDCSITLEAGHTYEFINDGLVYEFKTGPYLGVNHDKIMI